MINLTIANKTMNECIFTFVIPDNYYLLNGHFPDNPIMPAVGLVEVFKQGLKMSFLEEKGFVIKSISRAKFLIPAKPHDELQLKMTKKSELSFSGEFSGQGQQLAVLSANIAFTDC